jgi:hypothetical protein
MVLVSSTYAYSALQKQQSASEFQAMQKSIQTFDDTVRDVAWNRASTRATRFTAEHGFIEIAGNNSLAVSVAGTGISFPAQNQPLLQTACLRYNLSTTYLTFGDGYRNYVSGDNKLLVNETTQGVGQILISQESEWLNIDLSYRVRILVEPTTTGLTYVDILVTQLGFDSSVTHAGDFDLLAKNLGISTMSSQPVSPPPNPCQVNLTLTNELGNEETDFVRFELPTGTSMVVFNFVVSTVRVMV